MATASSFSYAQAAKGQGGPTTQQPAINGQNENAATASASDNATSTTESLPEVPSSISSVDAQPTAQEKVDIESVSTADSEARPESSQGRRAESKKDEELGRLDRPWRRNDKGTRSSSATTRSVDEQESRRPRKGKKGKAAEKQSGESNTAQEQEQEQEQEEAKIELSEAPIPSVNIWHQRKEAHLAKVKPTDGDNTEAVSKPAGETTRAVVPEVNGAKPHEKVNEGSRVERNGSRGSRVAAKEAKSAIPPPVQDATLWPTVETAIKEDKKKSTDVKTERPEKEAQDDSAQSKQARPKKEWVAYDYVPTVNFETQLPPIRGSKPRGGAKGASGGRAAAAQPSEKGSAVVASKANEPKDKSKEGVNGPNRPASIPTTSKRPAGEGAANRSEQRRQTLNAGAEKAKDVPSSQQNEQVHSAREGRSERGRGGFRGRAGHHAVNPHTQHQHSASAGVSSFQGQGPAASRSQGHYSPPTRQGGHNQNFIPAGQRGGRGARNAGNNWHRASLPNGATRPAPVQTQFAAPPYDYPVQPMSAVPFQQPPYWDTMMVPMLRSQIEYYFSIENLCKDMYLRQRMDSQGFVPLLFITAFKRMRELSPDTSLIRSVCEESNEIDYVVGEDDCERVRRRHGWVNFVLPMEERDELARNHGPQHITYKSRSYNYNPQYNGVPQVPYGMPSPHGYPTQGNPMAVVDDHSVKGVNGLPNGNGVAHGVNSSLSAEVPDFAPSFTGEEQASLEVQPGLTNGHFVPAAVNGLPNGIHSQE